MYERFTERARRTMQLANQEAMRFAHEYIGTEHILLGLVKEGTGVAVQVLTNLTIDPLRVVAEIESLIQKGASTGDVQKYPQTPRAKKVIEYAMQEARNLKHSYVGTEHVLLGLLAEDEGVAAQVLMNFGLRRDVLLAEIEDVLRQPRDWGRLPPPPQFPAQLAAKSRKGTAEIPQACPQCGQPVVRVVWRLIHLFGRDLEDVNAGRAILGSSRSSDEGPPWVCLNCAPKWSEVHRLAMQDYDLQIKKENAVAATDFQTAAQYRDVQVELRRQLALLHEEISRNQ